MNNKDEEQTNKLSVLESFFQFDLLKLTDKQKDTYSLISLIFSIVWLTLSFLGIIFGLIWIILFSILLFKMIQIGLKSKKKWISIISILLYVVNIIYLIIVFALTLSEI